MTTQPAGRNTLTLPIGGVNIVLTTIYNDFMLINPKQCGQLTVGVIQEALLPYLDSTSDTRIHQQTSTLFDMPVLGTLTMPRVEENPWEESSSIWLDLVSGEYTRVILSLRTMVRRQPQTVTDITSLILGHYSGAVVSAIGIEDGSLLKDGDAAFEWELSVDLPMHTTIGTLFHLQQELAYALFYQREKPSTPRQAFELVRLSGAPRLIGMQENGWLEAKRAPYDLKDNRDLWKLELAQDVASFANAELGGLIVIGIATKSIDGSDVLYKVHPITTKSGRARQYHDILRSRLTPLIDGLHIESFAADEGEVMCIYIPPQREELKPFIVDGGTIDGTYSGSMLSIVRRRGEDTVALSAAEVHALLTAGRAFLQLGHDKQS